MAELVSAQVEVEQREIAGSPGFGFTAVGIEKLGASEYTLVTIAIDLTGSTYRFAALLREMLMTIIGACKLNPMKENLMVRVIGFSTDYPNGIKEFHGFVPLSQIDESGYPHFDPSGLTPLNDAAFSLVGASADYGRSLTQNRYLANGIGFVITDGLNNSSIHEASDVAARKEQVRVDESLESLMLILVRVNAAQFKAQLDEFAREAEVDKDIDAGAATPENLARLANFVSQSISSQSQARGTGGPSQNISATI